MFEDDFPFPHLGYVSSLEGMYIYVYIYIYIYTIHPSPCEGAQSTSFSSTEPCVRVR